MDRFNGCNGWICYVGSRQGEDDKSCKLHLGTEVKGANGPRTGFILKIPGIGQSILLFKHRDLPLIFSPAPWPARASDYCQHCQ